jgi:hypothetical protein
MAGWKERAMSDLQRRLGQLERRREDTGHVCSECGLPRNAIRAVILTLHGYDAPPDHPPPPEDLCPRCRLLKPPIRVIERFPADHRQLPGMY